MKKYILNLLTCGLYSQVNELKEELKNIPKSIDENSVTDLIQDHHNDYVDGIYLKDSIHMKHTNQLEKDRILRLHESYVNYNGSLILTEDTTIPNDQNTIVSINKLLIRCLW